MKKEELKKLQIMKDRLELIIKNNDRDIRSLKFNIERIEWKLKNAYCMCAYTKEDLEEMKDRLKKMISENNRLKWALEG